MGFPAGDPHAGQTSWSVYRPQARHLCMRVRTVPPHSFLWNVASPPFVSRALVTRAAAFVISSSAVL